MVPRVFQVGSNVSEQRMKMPGQNEKSLELLRSVLSSRQIPAVKKRMFGHETYFLRDYMFAGVFGEDVFVHTGQKTVEANNGNGIGFFEPMPGRRMKAYLTIAPEIQTERTLKKWLELGARYLQGLPAKKKPARKKAVPAEKKRRPGSAKTEARGKAKKS